MQEQSRRNVDVGAFKIESEVQHHSDVAHTRLANFIVPAKYIYQKRVSTTTNVRTVKPMQGLDGVSSHSHVVWRIGAA
jgi:hypothetical protein